MINMSKKQTSAIAHFLGRHHDVASIRVEALKKPKLAVSVVLNDSNGLVIGGGKVEVTGVNSIHIYTVAKEAECQSA